MSDDFNFIPNWSDTELEIYNTAFSGTASYNDYVAQALYHEGYFNMDITSEQRIAIREELDRYMWDTYEVQFSDVFDWVAWREAYGETV